MMVSWCLLCSFVAKFTGSKSKQFQRGGRFFTTDKDCQRWALEADKAMGAAAGERLELVAEFISVGDSDDEEDGKKEEEEERMAVDDLDDGKFETKDEHLLCLLVFIIFWLFWHHLQ